MACLLCDTEAIRIARCEKAATIKTIPTAGLETDRFGDGVSPTACPNTHNKFVLRMRGLNDDGRRKKAQAKSDSLF
jgi:hypothetical protein